VIGATVWEWALSAQACDSGSARRGDRGAAVDGQAGLSRGAALRDYSSCVHGLGHGLQMAVGEVERSVAACSHGPRGAERCQCASGVYMQAQMEGRRATSCDAAPPYARPACWLRHWTTTHEHAFTPGVDPCGMASTPLGRAACAFGWAKATMVPWHRRNNEPFASAPTMRTTKGAASFLYYCAVFRPRGGGGGGGATDDRAWRSCLFGAISDLAREKRAGIELLSRQAVDDGAGGAGKWRVLRAACETYFPPDASALGTIGGSGAGQAPLSAAELTSVRALCLDALLSHASFEFYSPCGLKLLTR